MSKKLMSLHAITIYSIFEKKNSHFVIHIEKYFVRIKCMNILRVETSSFKMSPAINNCFCTIFFYKIITISIFEYQSASYYNITNS